MKTLKLILWIVTSFTLFLTGIAFLLEKNFILGVLLIFIGVWLIKSIRIIGPTEMAVFVWLGVPVGFRDSGPRIVPLFFAKIIRYPKKMYNLDFMAREVITKSGIYGEKEYGGQVLRVDATVYLNFPREQDIERYPRDKDTHPLIKILRSDVPVKEEELKDWIEEVVLSTLRAAFGQITWREAVQDIEKINRWAEESFKKEGGTLVEVGFREPGIKLVISEIHLPHALQKAMPEVDKQRLQMEAAPFKASQRSIEAIGSVVRMIAESRGKTIEEIQETIKTDPELQKEFLNLSKDLIKRQVALDKNSFVDIRVDSSGNKGVEEGLLSLLAAWQRMPKGLTEEKKPKKGDKKTKKTAAEEQEELLKALEEEEDEIEDEDQDES